MDFLNKIGQRNASKYLIFISIALSLLIYGLKFFGFGVSQIKPDIISIVLGTVIFSLANIILSVVAHKSKEYRLISVFSSGLIVLLNSILFSLSLKASTMSGFLFIVAIIEAALASIFLLFVIRKEKQRKTSRAIKNKQFTVETSK